MRRDPHFIQNQGYISKLFTSCFKKLLHVFFQSSTLQKQENIRNTYSNVYNLIFDVEIKCHKDLQMEDLLLQETIQYRVAMLQESEQNYHPSQLWLIFGVVEAALAVAVEEAAEELASFELFQPSMVDQVFQILYYWQYGWSLTLWW